MDDRVVMEIASDYAGCKNISVIKKKYFWRARPDSYKYNVIFPALYFLLSTALATKQSTYSKNNIYLSA